MIRLRNEWYCGDSGGAHSFGTLSRQYVAASAGQQQDKLEQTQLGKGSTPCEAV